MVEGLRLEQVGLVRANGAVALQGVSTSISVGQVTALVGPSGAGKSSLLRLLNRMEDATSGRVLFDEVDVNRLEVLSLRRRVGMVFQLPGLFEGTVLDNLAYGPRLHRTSQGAEREWAKELLEKVGLGTELLERQARELSVGQQQRVSIARSMANKPEVLLMDEPTSALDPTAAGQILQLVRKLKEENGLTIVVVTHSIDQARAIADAVLFLINGELVYDGAADAFFADSIDPRIQAFLSGTLGGH